MLVEVGNGRTREPKKSIKLSEPNRCLFLVFFFLSLVLSLLFLPFDGLFVSFSQCTKHTRTLFLAVHKNEAIFNTGFKRPRVLGNRLPFSFSPRKHQHQHDSASCASLVVNTELHCCSYYPEIDGVNKWNTFRSFTNLCFNTRNIRTKRTKNEGLFFVSFFSLLKLDVSYSSSASSFSF